MNPDNGPDDGADAFFEALFAREAEPPEPDFAALDAYDWGRLLARRPQLAGKCDKWDKFRNADWGHLLSAQPSFADRCPMERLSLAETAKILAAQPGLARRAKEKKGIRGRILDVSVRSGAAPVEVAVLDAASYRRRLAEDEGVREFRELGLPGSPLGVEFGASGLWMELGDLEVAVRLDGETAFRETVSPADPRGVAFPETASPLGVDFSGGRDEWVVGLARLDMTPRATCVREVPVDFRFDPAGLVLPRFRLPPGVGPERLSLVFHPGIRLAGAAGLDWTLGGEGDDEVTELSYWLLSRDGARPFG